MAEVRVIKRMPDGDYILSVKPVGLWERLQCALSVLLGMERWGVIRRHSEAEFMALLAGSKAGMRA